MRHLRPFSLVILTFALVFTVGFFGLVYPRLTTFGQTLAALDAATKAAENVRPTPKPVVNKTALEAEAAQVDALLPDKNELYDLSIQVEALAKSVPITINTITLTPVTTTKGTATTSTQAQAGNAALTPPNGAQKLSISLGVTGSYVQIEKFVSGLTVLGRYVEVSNVAYTKGSADTNMTAQISAAAFYFDPPTTNP